MPVPGGIEERLWPSRVIFLVVASVVATLCPLAWALLLGSGDAPTDDDSPADLDRDRVDRQTGPGTPRLHRPSLPPAGFNQNGTSSNSPLRFADS